MKSQFALLPLFALLQAPAPSAKALEFEVASIRPTMSLSGVAGGCRGRDGHFGTRDAATIPLGRCVVTAARVSHLVSIAYHVDVNRVSGDPHWEGADRFDIQAKAESPTATQEELKQMLESLLADRFKLKLHIDERDVP